MAPGQRYREDFPRFGLPLYMHRFPESIDTQRLTLKILAQADVEINLDSANLNTFSQTTDFHCVTSWSVKNLTWSGYKFIDFYQAYVVPSLLPNQTPHCVSIYAQDGYRTTLLLEDILKENVLLATHLNNQSLTIEHGAPIRLIAPNHYGYKNLKHLSRIVFHASATDVKTGVYRFLDHPRARVAKEERSRWVPGYILRYVYRTSIESTIKNFRQAMSVHLQNKT